MRNSNAVGLLETRINAVWPTLGGHSAPPSFICPCVIEKMESGLSCCSAAAVCPQLQGDDAREWRGTPSTSPGERGAGGGMLRGSSLLLLFLFGPSVMSDSSATPMGCSPSGSSVHGIL